MDGVQNNGGLEAFENFAWIMSDGCSDYSRFSTTQMSGLLGAICVSPAVPEGNGKDAFMAAWDRDANGQPDSYAFYAHDVRVGQTCRCHRRAPSCNGPTCRFKLHTDPPPLINPTPKTIAGRVGARARNPRRPPGECDPDGPRGARALPQGPNRFREPMVTRSGRLRGARCG